MSVVEAVRKELELLPSQAEAAAALVLATIVDDDGNNPTARTNASRELRETMTTLRSRPLEGKRNQLDDLSARRVKRGRPVAKSG